jgi:catechol 2,3-dioxygenase-like lactoylglutathione lyase family enzyme
MRTSANDHTAVRVSDMDRAIAFYEAAFGARALTRPFLIEGELPEAMFGGTPGVSFRLCHLAFATGMIELFELQHPREPAAALPGWRAGIMHVGFQVDDVRASAARVLEAGGQLIVEVRQWGAHELCFVADPDGNVIEIADAPLGELLAGTFEQFPEADPGGEAARGEAGGEAARGDSGGEAARGGVRE